ncbi:histidine kinase dimerization/phospho-acceptor domain-containing protein [Microbacterium sp. CH12i]|uniref:histidine kinase dimerization/phospho-acceptor domain-containing protein n=1 Tax=Microbacterium sp. CH12i TaxID=1479651 RepID=UPI00068E9016|nr:HAMP domain-containing sensor histidine kinase [Microbacterium sp. CH12i]
MARIIGDEQVRVLKGIEGPYVTAIMMGDTQELDLPGPQQFVAVIDPSGTVVLDRLPDVLADRVPEFAAAPDGLQTVKEDSAGYLVRSASVEADAGTWQVLTASGAESEVLDRVAFLLIASIAGINLAFGAASWMIGTAALSPVARLRRSAAELVDTRGADLLPVGPARDEIADLAVTLNELIQELRASADRERQIVSDASHEFRTPLAIIQTRLELAQQQATTLDEMRVEVSAAQRTLARLSSLATSLLELSRIDAQTERGSATVDQLAIELAEAADRGRMRVTSLRIRIEYTDATTTPGATVSVSVEDFGRVCDNLVGNAVAAIGHEGDIELRLTGDDDGVCLSVADTGGGDG